MPTTIPNILTRYNNGDFESGGLPIADYTVIAPTTNLEISGEESNGGTRSLKITGSNISLSTFNTIFSKSWFKLALIDQLSIPSFSFYRYNFFFRLKVATSSNQSDLDNVDMLIRYPQGNLTAQRGINQANGSSVLNNITKNTWISTNTSFNIFGSSNPNNPVPFFLEIGFSNTSQAPINIDSIELFIDDITVSEILEDDILSASFVKSNVTVNGGSDGSISVSVDSGSGSYSFLWNDGVTTQNRVNIPAGIYSVVITDNITSQEVTLSDINVTEPAIEQPVLGTFLEVPQINSIRFVDESVLDQCSNPQNADNSFLYEQGDRFMKRDGYDQKFNRCDTLNIQFKSDFIDHVAQIMSCETNQQVGLDLEIVKVFDSLGSIDILNVRIQSNGGSQSRVYFTASSSIPRLISVGDSIEIVNNADGFNGVYEAVNILNDDQLGSQYLIINRIYDAPNPTSFSECAFQSSVLEFDILQTIINFSSIPQGRYYVRIVGLNNDVETIIVNSEPIDLRDEHEATIKIDFTNNDNAFDVNYQSGIIHQIRVPARMYKRVPSANQTSITSTNEVVTKLSAKPQRKFNLEFFNIPAYLHELISVAFNHDTVNINGVEFGSQDGLSEPEYVDGYNLANSSIVVTQTEWFETYNGDDLGGVDTPGGLIDNGNGGFISLS